MTETTTGTATTTRSRRLVRPAMWAAGVLIAIAAIAFVAVPPVVKHYSVKLVGETLGREVSIERVGFNPFTLTAEIGGLQVKEADGQAEALGFDQLRANLEIESLLRGGVVLRELALAGPRINLVLGDDGRHNWADVVDRIAARFDSEDETGEGPLFSVGNIRLTGGRVSVHDKGRGLGHELTDIDVGVPFVSNLPVQVDVFVEPSLSAKLNGEPLLLSARTKPFADTHETVLDLVLKEFDLSPWVTYLPFEPRFRLPSALLTTDIEVSFAQSVDAPPVVSMRGPVRIDGLTLQDKSGAPVASVPEIELEFADVQPLIRRWHFTRLRLMQPELDLVRLKDGGLNLGTLMPVAKAPGAKGRKPARGQAGAKGSAKAVPAQETAAKSRAVEPDFLLAAFRIRDGVLRFEDRSLAEPFRIGLGAINLDMRDLATDADVPAEIRLDYVSEGGAKLNHEDRLRLNPFEFEGMLNFEPIQLARFAPYAALALPGGELRDGRVDGVLHYRVTLADDGTPDIKVTADRLAARDLVLALRGQKDAAVKVPRLDLSQAVVDVGARRVRVAELGVKGASVSAVRSKNGDLDLVSLVGKPAAKGQSAGPEWELAVDRLALEAASLRLEDRSVPKAVVTIVDGIELKLEEFSTAKGNAARLELESRVNQSGTLGARGKLVLDPLKAELEVDLRGVDLLPLQPYVLEQTKIAISRGSLTTTGALDLQAGSDGGLGASFRGDLAVANFASVDKLNATDFLRWRALRLAGIDAGLEPFSLSIEKLALDEFYTRLILDEQGQLNLREIQGQTVTAPAAELPAGEQGVGDAPRGVEAAGGDGRNTAELPPPSEPLPPIRIGRVDLKGGNIAFSDRFIRPNYDANLTDMAGELVGLSTDPTTLATLDLSGRVDNAAPVKVTGEFNPFRQDRHLDIVATVKDFELTGVSSYSAKYVGYGIARGKLSAELNYEIVDRKLTASNQIFLDQLDFGDPVDSPDAVDLPVRLAASLLKNSRGEIDLHLPISGTLDDPQFSIFGLVGKVLANIVAKAATAPFALLGSVVGGAEELSQLDLAPGAAAPGPAQEEKLEILAKALRDRPALRLDIAALADPVVDAEGVKQARLQQLVRAEKIKALIARGVAAPAADEVTVGPDEYPGLLQKVYSEAEFDKPSNILGIVKELPPAEMEALILANTAVGEAQLRALAQQRAQAIRDWLTSKGEVPGERIFVLEPKVEAAAGGGQVRFSLR